MDEHNALGPSSPWQHRNPASEERDVTTKLANVAAGEFVALEFETSFPNASGMIETLAPMLEKDGKGKVSGYFVKRAGG